MKKKFFSVAIFLIDKSFQFLFLSPHTSTPWTKFWFYTITYARPDQLNLSAALFGQSRSLFPISQGTLQTCHYINSVPEEHFFTSGALGAYPVALPCNDSMKPTNVSFFWEEPGMLAGRKTLLATQVSSMHISLTVCTQMKNLGQRRNVHVLREHSRQ